MTGSILDFEWITTFAENLNAKRESVVINNNKVWNLMHLTRYAAKYNRLLLHIMNIKKSIQL